MEKPELSVASAAEMDEADQDRLISMMNRYGCAHILQTGVATGPVETLLLLAKRFGEPIFYKLSDRYGIHPIRYLPGYPEYANANCEELALHTDGSFEPTPPTFMLMYCQIPAAKGGISRLASGDELYSHLQAHHPDYLRVLSQPGVFRITRDDRTATRAVFSPVGARLRLAYRSGHDVRLEVDPGAAVEFGYVRDWLLDPENFREFTLQPGEILIFDNTRMLHGRTAFSRASHRLLHGLWCGRGPEDIAGVNWGIDPQVRAE